MDHADDMQNAVATVVGTVGVRTAGAEAAGLNEITTKAALRQFGLREVTGRRLALADDDAELPALSWLLGRRTCRFVPYGDHRRSSWFEMVGLRWSDVDLDTAVIRVRQQITTVNGELMVSERTKTDRGQRNIDLDVGTVAVLKARPKTQAAHKLQMGAGWQNGLGLVFTESDGSPLDPESVAKVFDRRVARCEVPRIRFHDLRHTHVALLIAAGEQPLLVSRRLGHASASFTLDPLRAPVRRGRVTSCRGRRGPG